MADMPVARNYENENAPLHVMQGCVCILKVTRVSWNSFYEGIHVFGLFIEFYRKFPILPVLL